MNKIYYHLPGAFEYFNVYNLFIPIFFNERFKFYDFANIYCVYGCPLFFFWGGGRGGRGGYDTSHYAPYKDVKKFFKAYNIPISITASNLLITETDLYDRYPNTILEYFNEPGNSVIISNEILHKHIRKNYKNYLLISSTTKCLNEEETIKEYNNDYDFIVINRDLNNNWNFLNNLTNEQKSKTELLMNQSCKINCPNKKQHDLEIAYTLLYNAEIPKNSLLDCKWQTNNFFELMKRTNVINIDRIQNIYMPKGFTHFKIVGRMHGEKFLIYTLMHYFAKPEYRDELIFRLQSSYGFN